MSATDRSRWSHLQDTTVTLTLLPVHAAQGRQHTQLLGAATTEQAVQYRADFHQVRVVAGAAGILDLQHKQYLCDELADHRAALDVPWYAARGVALVGEAGCEVHAGTGEALQVERAIALFGWSNDSALDWLTTRLAQFYWINQAALADDTVLLVEAGLPPAVLESLALLWPPERIVCVPAGQACDVAVLHYFSPPASLWTSATERNQVLLCAPAIAWLSGFVRARAPAIGQALRSVLCSPADAAPLLLAALQADGFELGPDATVAFTAQAGALANVRSAVLVGSAAAVNVLWLGHGATLLLITPNAAPVGYGLLKALAQALGLRLQVFALDELDDRDAVADLQQWLSADEPRRLAHEAALQAQATQPPGEFFDQLNQQRQHKSGWQQLFANQPSGVDVTVAVMSYNNSAFIGQTIDSILAQEGVTFEVLVFDDCSKDHSMEILQRYASDPRVRVEVNAQNLGMTGNYNKCVQSGSGRYVVVLGSADVLYPGHLASLVAALDNAPKAGLGYTQCNWIDEQGKLVRYAQHPGHRPQSYSGGRDEVVDLLSHDNYITPSAVMLRRSILGQITQADGSIHRSDMLAGDWELWIRLARLAPDFVFLHQPSVGYRVHGGQISNSFYGSDKPLAEHTEILELNLADAAVRQRMVVAAQAIWNLYHQRIQSAPAEAQARFAPRIEAIRAALFAAPLQAAHDGPRFSIILTTYNRADLLVDALASLAAQTFTDFEVILINDAGAPVEHVLQGYDFPITYLALGRNGGLSNARNCGIRQARGLYLCYLDDDDMWRPQHLERHAQAQAQGPRLVYTDTLYILETLEGGTRRELSRQSSPSHGAFSRENLLVQNNIPVNAWSHPRAWLDQVGGFDVELPALEDWDMLLKLSAQYPVEHVPEQTVQVHIRQESPEQRMSARERKNFPGLFRRLYGRHGQGVEPMVEQARREFLQSLDDEMSNKTVGQPSFGYLHKLTPQVLAAFNQRLQGATLPTIEVLVLALPGSNDAAVQQSLESLAGQLSGAPHQVVSGDWQQVNAAALASTAEWLYLLPAGDCLEPHALTLLLDRVLHAPAGCYYSDEDSLGEQGSHAPIFKPDFNLDLLRSYPYTGRSLCVSREALEQLGGLRAEFEGLAVQDLQLRCVESFGLDSVAHIGEVLCHSALPFAAWLVSEQVQCHSAKVVSEHLNRLGVPHTMQEGVLPGFNRIRYDYPEQPLVSILVPTKDQLPLLQRCVETLLEKTAYTHFELLIIDNASETEEAKTWLAGIEQLGSEQIRVVRYPGPFNFSAINNAAAAQARGEYLVLLNNDTAILREDWLDELLNHARRPEVGIVGAKLLFPSGHIQHAGVVLGLSGPADHPFLGDAGDSAGYMNRLLVTQNYSAVTAACLIIRKEVYDAVGGLDEVAFKVSYNDVDLCLKVREAGYLTVWTPYSVLLHEGSVSQKSGVETLAQEQKLKRFRAEQASMYQKWLPLLARDPAYNPNLSLANKGFELDPIRGAIWQPFALAPLPRILAHPADSGGCGHYRVRQPFTAMQREGVVDGVISETLLAPVELERFQADVIVFQRQVTDEQLEAMAEMKQLSNAFRIYELDDYLPNLPLKSVHRADMPKDVLRSLRRALTLVDRFVVSTQPLAESLAGMHPDIRVVPNRLPTNWWNGLNSQRRVGRKPRVGWAGGVGHTGDLELIVDVVRDLADEVEWVFFGLCPEKIRPYVAEFYPGVTIDRYPALLASLNLDLALAPLEQNQFNDCKSNLRLLEYGFLGFPVICTDAICYRGDMPVTRVKNRYKDWVDAIRMHLADLDGAAKMGDELQTIVRRDWMLEGVNVQNWAKAWMPD
jgi:glycosyltransferase involved in cell wall biosynthesis